MRSYDARGLMKLSEDTSAVFENAWDVLASNDPEMTSKTVFSDDQNLSGEDNCFLRNEQENMPPGVLVRDSVCMNLFPISVFCSFWTLLCTCVFMGISSLKMDVTFFQTPQIDGILGFLLGENTFIHIFSGWSIPYEFY